MLCKTTSGYSFCCSVLLGAGVIIVYCCIIVVIKGIIIPCFSFMLTLMNNVEKDAATRTNTGKTEKETRPNQPARDQPAREPSPPTSMSTTTYRNYMTNYSYSNDHFYDYS